MGADNGCVMYMTMYMNDYRSVTVLASLHFSCYSRARPRAAGARVCSQLPARLRVQCVYRQARCLPGFNEFNERTIVATFNRTPDAFEKRAADEVGIPIDNSLCGEVGDELNPSIVALVNAMASVGYYPLWFGENDGNMTELVFAHSPDKAAEQAQRFIANRGD